MRDDDDRVDIAVRTVLTDVPPMSETSFTSGRERVLAAASSALARQRPVRRWVGVAAAATVLAAGAVTALTLGGPGSTPSAHAEAVAILTKAADLTAHATDTPVGPGQYRYIKKVESRWYGLITLDGSRAGAPSANCWFRAERTTETWIPTDRNQDWLQRTSSTEPLETRSCTKDQVISAPFYFHEVSPWESRAKQGWFTRPDVVTSSGRKQLQPPRPPDSNVPEPAPPPNIFHPTPEFLAGLPRDPQKLFVLLRDSTCLDDACAFVAALDTLSTGQIPGELRAAIYQALTRIPGMTIAERQANLAGRQGTAITVKDGTGKNRDLIIDPMTGDYIGDRSTTPDTAPGTELLNTSAVTNAVADTLGSPPRR